MPAFSCSSSKDVSERRALMIPKTSEIPRNKAKYKEVEHTKKNSFKSKKSKYNRSRR
jgi:hypothetical protein